MAKRPVGKKTNGSGAPSEPRVSTIVSRGGARQSAEPEVACHFVPPTERGTALSVVDLAAYLVQTERWPAERMAATQLRQAHELIRYAQKMAPFYRVRLTDIVTQARGGLTADLFAAIPILSREEVQRAGDALFSARVPRGHGKTFDLYTSGSSGAPVHVRSTGFSGWFNAAVTLRGHRWFDRDLSATNVTIRVTADDRPRARGRGWAAGSSGANFTYSNRVPVRQLFDWLLADDPAYLQCHPSILQALIHRSREVGAKPARLRDVRSMGEILEPGLRELCRREWGVPVCDNYSCEELAILALTCPREDHLHIQSERVLVEILDDAGRPCAPGETGRVVVTGLANFATPLIRYELGDRAVAGAPCPAFPGLAVVERIVGRERQPILLPSGDRLFPVLDAEPLLLKGGVRQYQLVQVSRTAMQLNLVAERRLSALEEDEIRAHLQRNFGHPFAIEFAYVDEIPREPSGKFLLFKSDVV